MSSYDEILSKPATAGDAPYPIHPFVNHYAGPELRDILGHSFEFMTHELKRDLWAKVAAPDPNQWAQAIDMWIARLNLIKSGLASFPMLIDGGGTSNTTQPLTITSPADLTTQAQQASPCQASITACLERDQYQCIVTGRKVSDRSGTEVVPIIPSAFAHHPSCRDLDFWKMLDLFYGEEAIDRVFAGLLERVNSLENLITLDSSIHAMFNSGRFTLTPGTKTGDPIPLSNDQEEGYLLNIQYPLGVYYPQFIHSTKGLTNGQFRTLFQSSWIAIASQDGTQVQATTLPLPSYFTLRAFVLNLKNTIAFKFPNLDHLFSGTSSTPSPVTPIDYCNQYTTHLPDSDSPCADPVFAASAMLQALVDDGALEQSP